MIDLVSSTDGTLARQPIQQARDWLAKCFKSHLDCRKSGWRLPLRLVKVRHADNDVSAKVVSEWETPAGDRLLNT